MSCEVPWNKVILEEFVALAQLNETEEWVMRTRVAGWPRSQQARQLNISVETLDRTIRLLKAKYDKVQPLSPLLPPRRSSKKETWMDNH